MAGTPTTKGGVAMRSINPLLPLAIGSWAIVGLVALLLAGCVLEPSGDLTPGRTALELSLTGTF